MEPSHDTSANHAARHRSCRSISMTVPPSSRSSQELTFSSVFIREPHYLPLRYPGKLRTRIKQADQPSRSRSEIDGVAHHGELGRLGVLVEQCDKSCQSRRLHPEGQDGAPMNGFLPVGVAPVVLRVAAPRQIPEINRTLPEFPKVDLALPTDHEFLEGVRMSGRGPLECRAPQLQVQRSRQVVVHAHEVTPVDPDHRGLWLAVRAPLTDWRVLGLDHLDPGVVPHAMDGPRGRGFTEN